MEWLNSDVTVVCHYAGLLRKGLDSAGFSNVPILATDVNDTKKKSLRCILTWS